MHTIIRLRRFPSIFRAESLFPIFEALPFECGNASFFGRFSVGGTTIP